MTTRRLVTARGALALVASMCLVFGPAPTAARAAQASSEEEVGRGSLHGTLYQPDEKGPLAFAQLTAINVRSGKQYKSNVTTENGNYDVDRLPAGTYDVVIEVGNNIFVTDRIIDIGAGESMSRSYSVQPMRPANRTIARMPAPKGSATQVGELELKPPFWTSTGGKVLIGVLGAGAAAAIINASGNNNASPSSP